MNYIEYNHQFWADVALCLTQYDVLSPSGDPIDPEAVWAMARACQLGVDSTGICHIGGGWWGAETTADRLHRKLGLR